MTLTVKVLLAIALLVSILIPFGAFAAGEKSRGRYKAALAVNSFLFFGTMLVCCLLFFSGNAFAAEETASAASNSSAGMICMAAALSTGLSCLAAASPYLPQHLRLWEPSARTVPSLVNL